MDTTQPSLRCDGCGAFIHGGVEPFAVDPDEDDAQHRSEWRFFHLHCWFAWAEVNGAEQ
jgi:hypothetical protein